MMRMDKYQVEKCIAQYHSHVCVYDIVSFDTGPVKVLYLSNFLSDPLFLLRYNLQIHVLSCDECNTHLTVIFRCYGVAAGKKEVHAQQEKRWNK